MRTTAGTSGRTARRQLVVTGLAGVALLGLTACGGSAPSSAAAGSTSAKAVGTPAAAAGSASAGSSSASSAASSATSSGAPSAGASGSSAKTPSAAQLTAAVTSAIKAKSTARLAMSSATLQRATGVLRYKRSGVDFAMTAGLPGGKTMKMVIVAGTAYLNVGEKYQGKSWIRIAPGGSDPLSKALGPMLTQLSTGMDLDAQLAGVKDAKITAATRTDVGGVPVTKYTVVSSEKALLARLDKFAATAEVRKALRAQFTGAHAESQMWISKENLPLRIDSRVVGGKAPGTTTTVTYSDWGRPVSIAVPPAGDTVNLAG